MGTPGGGRTFITPRFLRHLNLISVAEFNDDTLNKIFTTILGIYFKNAGINEDIRKSEYKVV
jgi:dynein heavy chain